jgi:hexaprenyl-diphosphate synthase
MSWWACAAAQKQVLFHPSTSTITRYRRYHTVLAQKTAAQNKTRPSDPNFAQRKPTVHPRPDPYLLVAPELSRIRENLLGLLGSTHPGLSEIARYYFLQPSKQLRSLVVLLISRTTNGLGKSWHTKHWEAKSEADTGRSAELDQPLRHSDVLNNSHPAMPNDTASFASVFELQRPGQQLPPPLPSPSQKSAIGYVASPPFLLPTQLRLAQIMEMIHIASILHDDVHDPSANLSLSPADPPSGFGNKLSILGGDFLLGRASTALSRLGDSEVVELVAGVISNLVEGEMLKMHGYGTETADGPKTIEEAWDIYMRKTYLKTASLIAKSARAAVILGGCTENDVWKDVAYAYGRNLGIAYQVCLHVGNMSSPHLAYCAKACSRYT